MDYTKKLSDIIASLPEIEGGFIYDPDAGIVCDLSGGITDPSGLQQAGLKLSKVFNLLSVHFADMGNMRITFKELILFGMQVENGQWLFLLHQPSLSPGMMKMTVQLALNIEEEEQQEKTAVQQEQEVLEEEQEEQAAGEDIIAILQSPDSELSAPLNTIKEELAQHIGPVAELVFNDSTVNWASNFSPSLETLPELITLMGQEIDEEGDRKEFIEALKAFFPKEA